MRAQIILSINNIDIPIVYTYLSSNGKFHRIYCDIKSEMEDLPPYLKFNRYLLEEYIAADGSVRVSSKTSKMRRTSLAPTEEEEFHMSAYKLIVADMQVRTKMDVDCSSMTFSRHERRPQRRTSLLYKRS